jgi:hypothetical protein
MVGPPPILTCKQSLVDFEVGKKSEDDTSVGWDDISALEKDDIASVGEHWGGGGSGWSAGAPPFSLQTGVGNTILTVPPLRRLRI